MDIRSATRADWRHYLFAVLCMAAAVWLRLSLDPLYGSDPGFTGFYFAVLLVAWLGGLGPALLSVVAGGLAFVYFVLEPRGTFLIADARVQLRFVLFILSLLGIAVLGGRMHFERAVSESRAAALEAQRRFFKTVIDAVPGMIGYWDAELRNRLANEAYNDWFGKSPEQVVGMNMRELLGEELFTRDEAHIQGALRGVAHSFFSTMRKADGSRGDMLVEFVPDLDKGHVQGFFVLVTDVTALQLSQRRLDELNLELARRVETAEATNRDLHAANSELDAFAYAVSHDLRAPLRALSGFAQVLDDSHALRLDQEGRACLAGIQAAARRMEDLVSGLLVLANPLQGELRHDAVDVTSIATSVLAELAHGEPQRVVEGLVEPGLVVTGDKRMIASLLENLIGNAWKYTGKAPAPRIRIYRGEVGGIEGLCVQDNGAGFEQREADRLFKPFQRLHPAQDYPGLGLGLATVMRIVRRHGGQIRAQSQIGQGATFCVWLPGPTLPAAPARAAASLRA